MGAPRDCSTVFGFVAFPVTMEPNVMKKQQIQVNQEIILLFLATERDNVVSRSLLNRDEVLAKAGLYLSNRFHVVVRLFRNRLQMTSTLGRKKWQ